MQWTYTNWLLASTNFTHWQNTWDWMNVLNEFSFCAQEEKQKTENMKNKTTEHIGYASFVEVFVRYYKHSIRAVCKYSAFNECTFYTHTLWSLSDICCVQGLRILCVYVYIRISVFIEYIWFRNRIMNETLHSIVGLSDMMRLVIWLRNKFYVCLIIWYLNFNSIDCDCLSIILNQGRVFMYCKRRGI